MRRSMCGPGRPPRSAPPLPLAHDTCRSEPICCDAPSSTRRRRRGTPCAPSAARCSTRPASPRSTSAARGATSPRPASSTRGGALVAWRRPAGAGPRRSGSSARTPTRHACGSSRAPTAAAPAGGSSPSRSTAGCSSTAGSTATSASPAGSSLADGTTTLVDVAEPIARVPQLAIHLDRDVNERGLVLDRQTHLRPVWASRRRRRRSRSGSPSRPASRRAGVRGSCASTTCSRRRVLGADRSLLASGGSTTRCRAGRRRPRWPPPSPPTTSR